MKHYFDPDVADTAIEKTIPSIMKSTTGFDAKLTRQSLRTRGFLPENVVRYAYRPFEVRWIYWEPQTKLLDRNRASYFPQVFEGNPFLFTTGRVRKSRAESALCTYRLCDYTYMDSGARGFPLYLRPAEREFSQIEEAQQPVPNLPEEASEYLKSVEGTPEDLFYHCLAIMHSLTYRWENNDSLRLDWPRIPLPSEREALVGSAGLGRKVATLLDVESRVNGVTVGNIRDELRLVARLARDDGGQIDPNAEHLRVTAGWGYRQKSNRAIMAGQGKSVEREYTTEERDAFLRGAEVFEPSGGNVFVRLSWPTGW